MSTEKIITFIEHCDNVNTLTRSLNHAAHRQKNRLILLELAVFFACLFWLFPKKIQVHAGLAPGEEVDQHAISFYVFRLLIIRAGFGVSLKYLLTGTMPRIWGFVPLARVMEQDHSGHLEGGACARRHQIRAALRAIAGNRYLGELQRAG